MKPPAPAHTPIRTHSRLPILFAFLLPAVLLVTLAVRHADRSAKPATLVTSATPHWAPESVRATPAESRAIFPYSVVPGGVRDGEELRTAVAADPVVAEHYSGFRLAQAATVRLDRAMAMYVSYRVGNRVYWTKNKMVIPAGETLISDGEHLTRVRCGNRLSEFAAGPVSLSEPPREKLETPEWVPPLLAELLPGDGGEAFSPPVSALADFPVTPGETGTGPKGTLPPPLFPPILPPGVPTLGSNDGPTPPTPVPTPEPGSLILLLGGAVLSTTLTALLRK